MAYGILGSSRGLLVLIIKRKIIPLVTEQQILWFKDIRLLCNGKTLPKHVKFIIMGMVGVMTIISTYFVWYVSTKGDGKLMQPSTWSGADEYGMGSITIAVVGLIGILYIWFFVKTRNSVPQ